MELTLSVSESLKTSFLFSPLFSYFLLYCCMWVLFHLKYTGTFFIRGKQVCQKKKETKGLVNIWDVLLFVLEWGVLTFHVEMIPTKPTWVSGQWDSWHLSKTNSSVWCWPHCSLRKKLTTKSMLK